LARSARRGGVLELLLAARRSGVACRWKRHHSNGDDSNAAESNGIATAVARGSRQRWLGILSQQRLRHSFFFPFTYFYIEKEIEDHRTSTIQSSRQTSFSLSLYACVKTLRETVIGQTFTLPPPQFDGGTPNALIVHLVSRSECLVGSRF